MREAICLGDDVVDTPNVQAFTMLAKQVSEDLFENRFKT